MHGHVETKQLVPRPSADSFRPHPVKTNIYDLFLRIDSTLTMKNVFRDALPDTKHSLGTFLATLISVSD